MKGYSIGGYLNAVMRRSQRTLLVEGTSDKSVLQRLKAQRDADNREDLPGVIDVAELISDPQTSGLGMKAAIHVILQRISGSALLETRLGDKFGTLTDREWDGLSLDLDLNDPWFAPSQNDTNFVTIGHSVENYFFRLAPIEAFLRQFFSDHLNQSFFNALTNRFHAIIGFAVGYSLVVARIGCINKADRLISRQLIEWDGDIYSLSPIMNQSAAKRKIIPVENFYLLVNYGVRTYASRFSISEPGHWLCHGHLGEQAIWACVANLGEEFGVGGEVAIQIERGLNDVRFRHFVDYLCRDHNQTHAPLDAAIDWLIA